MYFGNSAFDKIKRNWKLCYLPEYAFWMFNTINKTAVKCLLIAMIGFIIISTQSIDISVASDHILSDACLRNQVTISVFSIYIYIYIYILRTQHWLQCLRAVIQSLHFHLLREGVSINNVRVILQVLVIYLQQFKVNTDRMYWDEYFKDTPQRPKNIFYKQRQEFWINYNWNTRPAPKYNHAYGKNDSVFNITAFNIPLVIKIYIVLSLALKLNWKQNKLR